MFLGYFASIEKFLVLDPTCVEIYTNIETLVYKIWPEFWASKNSNNTLGEHKYHYKYYWQSRLISYNATMEIIVDPIIRQFYYPAKDVCKHLDTKFTFNFLKSWTNISTKIKLLCLDDFIIKEKLPPLSDFITGYLVRDFNYEQKGYPNGFFIESDYAKGFLYKNFNKIELEKITYYDLVMYGKPKSFYFIHEPLTKFVDADSVKLYLHPKHVDKYPEYMFLWKYVPVDLDDFRGKTKVLNSEIYLDSYPEKVDEIISPLTKHWIFSDLMLQKMYPQFWEHTAIWNPFPFTSYEPYFKFYAQAPIEEDVSDFEKFWNDNKNFIDFKGSLLKEYFSTFPKGEYSITDFSRQEFMYNNFFGINPLLNNLFNNYFVIEIRTNGWFLVYKINEPLLEYNALINLFLLYFDWLPIDYHDRLDTIYYGSDMLNNHSDTWFLPQVDPGWRTTADTVFHRSYMVCKPDLIVDNKVVSYKLQRQVPPSWVELIPEEIKNNKVLYKEYLIKQDRIKNEFRLFLQDQDNQAELEPQRAYILNNVAPEAGRYKPPRVWHFFPHNAEWAAKYVDDDKEIVQATAKHVPGAKGNVEGSRAERVNPVQEQKPSKFEQSLYKLLDRRNK